MRFIITTPDITSAAQAALRQAVENGELGLHWQATEDGTRGIRVQDMIEVFAPSDSQLAEDTEDAQLGIEFEDKILLHFHADEQIIELDGETYIQATVEDKRRLGCPEDDASTVLYMRKSDGVWFDVQPEVLVQRVLPLEDAPDAER